MAKHVYYSGNVQGVGFRATAVSVARRYHEVRGWVRNLADGRVELLADGPDYDVETFLASLRDRMADHIRHEEQFDRDSDPTIVGFCITS